MRPRHALVVLIAVALPTAPTAAAHADDCLPHPPSLQAYTPVIDFGHGGLVTVKGDPRTTIHVKARPAASSAEADFVSVHQGEIDADGRVDLDVAPTQSTEYVVDFGGGGPGDTSPDCPNGRAYYDGRAPAVEQGQSRVIIGVRTVLSLFSPARTAPRSYRFTGAAKGHPGDLVNLYRVDGYGRSILAAQGRSTAAGEFLIDRRFTGSGTFGFYVASPGDPVNLGGRSGRTRVTIR
jgi:hypothetical protein